MTLLLPVSAHGKLRQSTHSVRKNEPDEILSNRLVHLHALCQLQTMALPMLQQLGQHFAMRLGNDHDFLRASIADLIGPLQHCAEALIDAIAAAALLPNPRVRYEALSLLWGRGGSLLTILKVLRPDWNSSEWPEEAKIVITETLPAQILDPAEIRGAGGLLGQKRAPSFRRAGKGATGSPPWKRRGDDYQPPPSQREA